MAICSLIQYEMIKHHQCGNCLNRWLCVIWCASWNLQATNFHGGKQLLQTTLWSRWTRYPQKWTAHPTELCILYTLSHNCMLRDLRRGPPVGPWRSSASSSPHCVLPIEKYFKEYELTEKKTRINGGSVANQPLLMVFGHVRNSLLAYYMT